MSHYRLMAGQLPENSGSFFAVLAVKPVVTPGLPVLLLRPLGRAGEQGHADTKFKTYGVALSPLPTVR